MWAATWGVRSMPPSNLIRVFTRDLWRRSQRERQRLLRITESHAGAWITAVPSTDDGLDTVMKPQVFRTAVKYRLGVRVTGGGVPYPLCASKPLMSSAIMLLHKERNSRLCGQVCREGMLSPVLEEGHF